MVAPSGYSSREAFDKVVANIQKKNAERAAQTAQPSTPTAPTAQTTGGYQSPMSYGLPTSGIGSSVGTNAGAPQMVQPKVNSPASGYTAPTTPNTPQSYTPNPVAPKLTAEQSGYFDKTYGGIGSYVDNQQTRYDQASASGNQDLLNGLNADAARVGYTFKPYAAPQATAQPNAYNAPSGIMSVASSSDLNREAQANIDKQRAGLEQGIDKFISGLKSGYDYSKQGTQDNRVLQDTSRAETVNPFAGKTSYDNALIGRQRTIEDGAVEREFNNELTAVKQQLLDFDRLAPEQQQALYQQLKRMERDYGLNLAQISGDLPEGMGRTLAGSAQDYAQNPNNPQNQGQVLQNQGQGIQNQLAKLQLENYPEQVKQQAALFEQELKSGKMSQEAAEYNLKELTDPESVTNKSKALQLQMDQLEAKNLPEQQRLQLQQLKKQISQIGVVHYKPQTATEIEMDRVKLDTAKEELSQLQNGTSSTAKFNTSLANSLKSTYTTTNNITKQDTLDKVGLRSAIIASLSTDEEIDQMLGYFGLPINE